MKLLRVVKCFLLVSTLLHAAKQSHATRSLRGNDILDEEAASPPAPIDVPVKIGPLIVGYAASEGGDGRWSLMNMQPSDCSACYDSCVWNDLMCFRDKVACNAYQALLNFLMRAIETACNTDPRRMDRRDLIGDAKKMLTDAYGIFPPAELDSVAFRFCDLDAPKNTVKLGMFEWLGRATGMTLSPNKIVFDYEYLDASTEDLAILMAHEMVHIRQYRRWGFEGFCCRYLKEVDNGNGFGQYNYIEKEAYDFEYVVEETIKGSA